jgi:hypothetical protein
MRSAVAFVCGLGVVLAAGLARAEEPAAAPCTPRQAEKAGMRFVEVCGSGVFISGTPLVCTPEERESAACDPVTALEASPLEGPGKNRHVDVLTVDADAAERLCEKRFGGRLPTLLEREQARLALGLATLQVREEPGEFARLRMDPLPEWVAEGGRVNRYPTAGPRPRAPGDVLLGCVAEPAMPQAAAVPIGSTCDERPEEGGVRSPNCAVVVPGTQARFELGCDPAHKVISRSNPYHAPLRCVLPESAFGKVVPQPLTGR